MVGELGVTLPLRKICLKRIEYPLYSGEKVTNWADTRPMYDFRTSELETYLRGDVLSDSASRCDARRPPEVEEAAGPSSPVPVFSSLSS